MEEYDDEEECDEDDQVCDRCGRTLSYEYAGNPGPCPECCSFAGNYQPGVEECDFCPSVHECRAAAEEYYQSLKAQGISDERAGCITYMGYDPEGNE